MARMGGDFFDLVLTPGHVVFLLTDIAGERDQTHAIAAEVQDVFRVMAADRLQDPDKNENDALVAILHEINRALLAASQGVRCASTFIATYNLLSGILSYINAGGPPALLRADGEIQALESNGLPLGLFTHLTHDAAFTVLNPGSTLLLVSKGVVEAHHHHEEFGLDRVRSILHTSDADTSHSLGSSILQAAGQWIDGPSYFGPRITIPGFRANNNEQDMTAVVLTRNS
jgi:serine phosphatase RsbU (regulator of sigma subunit)